MGRLLGLLGIVLLAGCARGAPSVAETPVVEPPPSPSPTAPRWEVQRSVDRMTDVSHFSLQTEGKSGALTLMILCHSSAPWMNVSLYSRDLWPSDDAFYVSTRLDSEPAKSLQRWSGMREFASPESLDAERAFIAALQQHRSLLARVGSSVMDKSVEDEFDLTGLPEAFASFEAECKGLRGAGA